jgi:hypothetical protein
MAGLSVMNGLSIRKAGHPDTNRECCSHELHRGREAKEGVFPGVEVMNGVHRRLKAIGEAYLASS